MSAADQPQQQQQEQQPAGASTEAWGSGNSYEARQEAKREALLNRAERVSRQANAIYASTKERADSIPFGQPILVGHHSERRDRRFREKLHNDTRKAFALVDEAKKLRGRAESVGTGGISSDDPAAIVKLQEQLQAAQQHQEHMKHVNKALRGKKTHDERVQALEAAGFSPTQIRAYSTPDCFNSCGFPSYKLTNNSANIRRLQARIEALEATRSRTDLSCEGKGYTYKEDTAENRIMFVFDGKPNADVRTILKRHAFKWSPTRGAWVRQMTGQGFAVARYVREQLDAL